MKVVIQRVNEASVRIKNKDTKSIKNGFVLLLGYESADTIEDIDWTVKKILNLRVFADKDKLMNLNLLDIDGELLCVSQFTLHAKTKKGNRPSFIHAAKPAFAEQLYNFTISEFEKALPNKVKTGIFGADMKVLLINDGPVTIIVDSKNKI
ncbi:MAG: D-aminoacyl-tRNA deacylase [Crocinitomicaceae bacterium]